MTSSPAPTLPRRGTSALAVGPLRAIGYPQYRILWAASIISIASFFLVNIARGWLVLEMTDSAFWVTAVQATGMLPTLFVSLIGGAIADRFDRKKIIIVTEAVNFVLLMALAALVITDIVEVWHIFLISLLTGIAFPLAFPARSSMVASLVERRDIASAVALFTTIFSAGQLVGPAVGGILIEAYGMGFTFLVSALALLPGIALLFLLKVPATAHVARRPSVLNSIVEGFGYVRSSPLLLGLMMLGFAGTMFAMPYQSILPVFAQDVLHKGAGGLGWLMAAGGAGALVGSIAVASLRSQGQVRAFLVTGALSLSVFVILFALSTSYALSLVLSLALGFLFQIFMTSNFTLVQIVVPDEIRGRVLSIRMIIFGMGPVGMLALGAAADALGPGRATAGMGLLGLAFMAAFVIVFPALRKGEAPRPQQPQAQSQEPVHTR